MTTVIIRPSTGALWVAERVPDKHFPEFQEELENAVLTVMEKYGYDTEIRTAFSEIMPLVVVR